MSVYLFDVDNTLADTSGEIKKRVANFSDSIYPFPLPPDFFELNPDVFLSATAFAGAAEQLHSIVQTGSKILYVTARAPWFDSLTRHWLRLNGFPEAPVICTANKRTIVEQYRPVYMVDDAPHEIDRVKDLVPCLVPAKPYNEGYMNRFEDWSSFPLLQKAAQ
ncbi:hypothetical protein [Paenibacillus abyssi]|uniref:Nucleotidase n=1 Tax=Paenibacillus abyssi TaxID=1340531 RepID=A0A917LFK7_9BACL|nr:hypothetical protein [Paenibacillus abyssi]GGG18476.1 hypothetical protein GCM10010916_39120 [Paenibacillus abyssi]